MAIEGNRPTDALSPDRLRSALAGLLDERATPHRCQLGQADLRAKRFRQFFA
jgi:hypothetical protein